MQNRLYTYLLATFSCSFLFSSCVTLLSRPVTQVKIKAPENTYIIKEKGITNDYYLFDINGHADTSEIHLIAPEGVVLSVPRSSKPLVIKVGRDSVESVFSVNHTYNSLCYLNIFNYGVGMIFDYRSPKKYSYPGNLYIESDKKGVLTLSRLKSFKPNDLSGMFSLSMLNVLGCNIKGVKYSAAGIFGVSAGADYCYKKNTTISAQSGISANLTPGERLGDTIRYQKATNVFFNVKHNHIIESFTVGYGLSVSTHAYESTLSIRDSGYTRHDTTFVSYNNIKLGAVFSGHYRIRNFLQLGIVYQPSFISLKPDYPSKYEYLVNFELLWKFH